jgi:hypothetical protein
MKSASVVLGVLLAVAVFAPSASAQYCSDTCVAYLSSCDEPCTQCVIFGYDYCAQEEPATCGTGGGACEGCAVTNTWTETTRTKTLTNYELHCLGRPYWWGYTNWSNYLHYDTVTTHTTYQTTACYGTGSTTQVIGVTHENDECYVFYDGACDLNQTHEGFVNGLECYF